MKKRYGKLVRDNIPDIIRKNSEVPTVRIMESDEYRRELLYKLIEEAEAVRQAGYDVASAELRTELADVLEVLEAILQEFDITYDELRALKEKRRTERGGFEKRLFLDSVEE